MQTILVYADPLLAPTMTFVRAQAGALKSFSPLYVGAHAYGHGGLALPADRVLVINGSEHAAGKLKEIPFKVFGYAPLFFRRIRSYSPVLIHAHSGPAGLTALPLSRWLRIPMVTTFHGSDVTVPDSELKQMNYRMRVYVRQRYKLRDHSRQFVAISEFIRKRLIAHGFPPERVLTLYTGVDTEFFKPDESLRREPLVLFVASMIEIKGCEYLLEAMSTVQAAYPEAELVLIGDGPLRSSLQRIAREKLRRVRFLGTQAPDSVKEWMNRATVFCVPSTRTRSGAEEGLGMVFLEAQAMRLPAVGFISGGVSEAVAHGETGLLAHDRDSGTLAKNILELLTNKLLWRRMGESGRRRVQRLFELKAQTVKLEQLYDTVLSEVHGSMPC